MKHSQKPHKQEMPQVIITTRESADFILQNLYPNVTHYNTLPDKQKLREEKVAVILGIKKNDKK